MIAVNGIYENGNVILDRKIKTKNRVNVVVTFLEEGNLQSPKRLKSNDFSFKKSRESSNKYTGSLSDEVIEYRKAEI